MEKASRPTIGLALSGSGNWTSFYIGFLEVFQEQGIHVDYISAMSGASLVAAAYACGTLLVLRDKMLSYDTEDIKKFISKNSESGGLYTLDAVEYELRTYITKGLTFEEVRPNMSFLTVDVETGDKIDLCMGDIARAACASCTLPGVFKPTRWGNRILVDGGILSQIPIENVKKFNPDVVIGVNMRGTKYIFHNNLITFRRVINFLKRILFIGELETLFEGFSETEEDSFLSKDPKIFSVLGKSLDIVIDAIKHEQEHPIAECDLMIAPHHKDYESTKFSKEVLHFCYHEGKKAAEQAIPQIKELVAQKQKLIEKV